MSQSGRRCIGLMLVLNTIASVGIVLLNKAVFRHGFPNLTLTMLHFVATFLGLLLCRCCGLVQRKRLPLLQMLPLSLTFCGFVALTNLSLQFNTVGTYQVLKTLTTPCIMALNRALFAKTSSRSVMLTFLPVVCGAALNSRYDLRFSSLGLLFALLGVLATSLYQIWVGAFQKRFACDSAQLLLYQAPLSALLLLPAVVVLEPPTVWLAGAGFGVAAWASVAASCGVAFFVNVSIYWIIGNTSALTYNMAGHLKLCSAILLGFLVFHDPVTLQQVLAICLVCGGVFAYSGVRVREEAAAARPAASVQSA